MCTSVYETIKDDYVLSIFAGKLSFVYEIKPVIRLDMGNLLQHTLGGNTLVLVNIV